MPACCSYGAMTLPLQSFIRKAAESPFPPISSPATTLLKQPVTKCGGMRVIGEFFKGNQIIGRFERQGDIERRHQTTGGIDRQVAMVEMQAAIRIDTTYLCGLQPGGSVGSPFVQGIVVDQGMKAQILRR